MMRPAALAYLYARRLRAHGVQELLAALGVAAAVALVLASTIAEQSIAGSTRRVVKTVVGPATLQLRARSEAGFPERLLARVEALQGVQQAAPLLEAPATVAGPGGRRVRVQLAGTNVSLATLNGLARTLPIASLSPGGIGLSRASANAIGITQPGTPVTVALRGHGIPLRVSAVLGQEAAGALSGARVAVMPLKRLQALSGLPGQISRVFIKPRPGAQATVRAELRRLAADHLDVQPADADVATLQQALGPSNLASGLFAAIGAVLGLLFAFNAILLTVPERRVVIADLRLTGARRSAIVQIVLFQALFLGLVATAAGLAAGYALSTGVFAQSTGYLAEAFTLGGGTIVGAGPLLLAGLGGVLATLLASAVPLLDLRSARTRDAAHTHTGTPGNALGRRAQQALFLAAVILLAAASVLYTMTPHAAILATGLLALATVLAIPLILTTVIATGETIVHRTGRFSVLAIALSSLRASTVRSLALAATGAVALFGNVALDGARQNLLAGISNAANAYAADSPIWAINPRDDWAANELATAAAARAKLAKVPGVASVRAFRGGFLDLAGHRRAWVIARPPGGGAHALASQLPNGHADQAERRLAEGGWVIASRPIAAEQHTVPGGTLQLPTPIGSARLRLAAVSSNLAWPPGVIFISDRDYQRLWPASLPTALAIQPAPDADPHAVLTAVRAALGPNSGIEASLGATRAASIQSLASEGLGQLGDIATLLLIVAILAMTSALASSIWQRRTALASLRLAGARPRRLRRILLAEGTIMLACGCLTGALVGAYGQLIIDSYLKDITGFPLAHATLTARPFEIFAVVLAAALALVTLPALAASRVTPALALSEQ